MSRLIKDFYRTIHLDDLSISYSGDFSDSMTEKIIELCEAYLDRSAKLSSLKRRTSFLVAECFQNVVRHSTKEVVGSGSSMHESFFLRFYENKCFIASENLIPDGLIENLRYSLNQVNRYNKDELREFYRQILDEGEFSKEGGAGLGLIEMARKTGNKLLYSFEKAHGDFSRFYLLLVLENKSAEGPEMDFDHDFGEIRTIIRNVQEDNIFVLYKGDFSSEVTDHIEQIISDNLDAQPDSLATKVKLYNAAILAMQKIGQFSLVKGKRQSGMLFFARNGENYMINATYPMDEEIRELVETILADLEGKSQDEIQEYYQKRMKQSTKLDMNLPEIGFLQLIVACKSWDYEFFRPEGMPVELIFQVHV